MKLDRRLLRLLGAGRGIFAISVACGLIATLLAVLQAGLLSRIVTAAFLRTGAMQSSSGLLVLLLVTLLLRAGFVWGMDAAGKSLSRQVKVAMRARLVAHLLSLGVDWNQRLRAANRAQGTSQEIPTADSTTGAIANLVVEGVERLEAYFSEYLPQLLLALLAPAVTLAFVFPVDWLSGVVLLLTAPLMPLFLVLIGDVAQAETQRQWGALSRMSAFFLDILQGMVTLRLLGRSQAKNIEQLGERYRGATLRVLRVSFLSALALELAATLSTAVVAVGVGLRLLYGRISFEPAFFVLLLAPEFYLPLRQLGARFHAGAAGQSAAESIFRVLDTPPPGTHPAASAYPAGSAPIASPPGDGGPIRFDQVSFQYEHGPGALHGVSFSLLPGQVNLLVGPSGSGKSTLALLLLKALVPASGQVWVGDRSLESFSEAEWLSKVAWVSQQPVLFNTSVAENIRLGQPQASREEVERAAAQALADGFIRDLPQGYDTPVGERGVRLSVGQAQRIALARAFLRQPELLIMDEAASGLDAVQDAGLRQTIAELARGRTTLIISHRLSGIEAAGQILYLEDGRLLGAGSDQRLSAACPPYRRLRAAYFQGRPVQLAARPELRPTAPSPVETPTESQEQPGSRAVYSDWQVLTWLFSLMTPFSGWVALSALLGFATVGSSVGLMATSAYLLSAAALQPSIAALQVSIVGVRAFGLLRGVLRYLERLVSHGATFRLLANLRLQTYLAFERQTPGWLVAQRSGDLLSRLVKDLQTLENFFARGLAPFLSALLTAALIGGFLGFIHPTLALTGAGLYLLAGVALTLAALRKEGRPALQARLKLTDRLVEGLQGMAELRAYQARERWQAEIETASRALADQQRRDELGASLHSSLAQAASWLATWSVLVTAIPEVASGEVAGVALASIVLAVQAAFEAIQPLPLAGHALNDHLQAARRLLEVVRQAPETEEADWRPAIAGVDLQVEKLYFAYPPAERSEHAHSTPVSQVQIGWTLSGLDFYLPGGGRLALVGPSGSGKSTLLHLLLRFWDYNHGSIRLGGMDIRSIPARDLYRRVALAPQRVDLFNSSLRDNLLIARPEATDDILLAALGKAQLSAWVESLPQGLDTWIGERGARLSAGERQRLSLARLFLTDAQMLLLDEPTSALDALTAQEVWQSLEQFLNGRSLILATHQLMHLETMDHILVLQGGQVVEQGSHAELIAQGGYYQRLWEARQSGAAKA